MVTVVDSLLELATPLGLPVQPENMKPGAGVAVIFTTVPGA
jgi:hypothetical protein